MTIVNGELHHLSVTEAFQCCVSPAEGQEILREIHAGLGGHHAVVLTELIPEALLDRSPGIVIELNVC